MKKMFSVVLCVLCVLGSTALLTGCPEAAPVPVTGVTLDQSTATLTPAGTVALTATVAPDTAADSTVSWSTSDSAVATVADGVVTAVAVGTATITVKTTDGEFTADCVITVQTATVSVTGVTLDQTAVTLLPAAAVTLISTVAPADATVQTVTWSTSDSAVATVANGVVTAVAEGLATITATTTDGAKTASCEITVSNKLPLFNFEAATSADNITIAAGYENGLDVSGFSTVRDTTNMDATNGGTACLAVTYGSDTQWRMTEVHYPVDLDGDYSAYTGIEFDIRAPYSENFLILLRGNNPNSTDQQNWGKEDYVWCGDPADQWQTVQFAFADLADMNPGWGMSASVDATVTAALGNADTVFTDLQISPVTNQGPLSTYITFYIDNIRFYK